MPCCIYTYRAYCVYVIEMLWYVWDLTPSCLFLVAFLMGKCILVLPSGTHGLTGMCPSLLLCLSLRGNVTRCFTGVLVACYDSVAHADDRHVHCWVTYACPCMFVPPWFTTSHVGPGSLSYGCYHHNHIREPKDANGPGQGKAA